MYLVPQNQLYVVQNDNDFKKTNADDLFPSLKECIENDLLNKNNLEKKIKAIEQKDREMLQLV